MPAPGDHYEALVEQEDSLVHRINLCSDMIETVLQALYEKDAPFTCRPCATSSAPCTTCKSNSNANCSSSVQKKGLRADPWTASLLIFVNVSSCSAPNRARFSAPSKPSRDRPPGAAKASPRSRPARPFSPSDRDGETVPPTKRPSPKRSFPALQASDSSHRVPLTRRNSYANPSVPSTALARGFFPFEVAGFVRLPFCAHHPKSAREQRRSTPSAQDFPTSKGRSTTSSRW